MLMMPGGAAPPPGTSRAPPPPGTVDIAVPDVVKPLEAGPMNVFVGKLPSDLHDNYIRQLLEVSGSLYALLLFVIIFFIAANFTP
jgi:hypothetical protein